jgi:hypothetical protein
LPLNFILIRIALRRVLVIFIIFFSVYPTIGLFSQAKKVHNLPAYDIAPYHFGFTLGLNQMLFTIKPMPDINTKVYYDVENALGELILDSAMVMGISSKPTFGFDIGIVGDKRLGRYFNLRFVPALSFGERYINYSIKTWNDGEVKIVDLQKNIGSVFIDFPVTVKYKSKRLNNMLAYVLAGGKYSLDIASNARKQDLTGQIVVKLNKNDVYAIVGVGFDFYNPWFKLGVELKMSYGLMDVLKRDDTGLTQSIESLKSKVFQLGFTFE